MTDPTPESTLELFDRIADSVTQVLADQTEWGASGQRTGQYAVDLVADAACVDPLLAAGFATLSEESGRRGEAGAPVVVVDPLDGSTNASRRIPWCATALCLVDDDGPWVALVANHATGQRFTAARGAGAHCDGEPIHVSSCERLADAIVGVNDLPPRRLGWAQFRVLGAAAADLCLVASGALDGWCDMGADAHGVWDYLASVLICQEAGAVVAEAHDRELCVLDHDARRTPVVGATPPLLDALLAGRRNVS